MQWRDLGGKIAVQNEHAAAHNREEHRRQALHLTRIERYRRLKWFPKGRHPEENHLPLPEQQVHPAKVMFATLLPWEKVWGPVRQGRATLPSGNRSE